MSEGIGCFIVENIGHKRSELKSGWHFPVRLMSLGLSGLFEELVGVVGEPICDGFLKRPLELEAAYYHLLAANITEESILIDLL